VSNLLGQQGAAQAGGALGRAAPFVQFAQLPGQLAGYQMATGRNMFGNLFGGTSAAAPATGGIPSGMIEGGVGFPG
jgi:hypothetical protein